ncbi:hypothetical protein CRG98_019863 [Punica granatum]|uniref:DUF7745 domain-containing protein n=1 Tax=Punica granatum TaxID=22663 RepID=A0A2I0JV62_PUNGR|nr:hypothetical protein CRG98_019863 [Punica granatum]
MISGDSFSCVSVTRPHGKVDTPKPRDPKACDAGLDESPHSSPYCLATPLGTDFVGSGSIRLLCLHGTELAPTIEEYAALIQRPMPTRDIVVPNQFATIQSRLALLLGLRDEEIRRELQYGWEHGIRTTWLMDFIHFPTLNATRESYQRDACHGFLLLIFGTILFPYSSKLIDGALAQVILQVIPHPPHADIPEAKSLVQGAMRTELQAIREERDRLRCELMDIGAELSDQRELQRELAQTGAHIASHDREIARVSAMLDRTRAKARKVSHP